MKFVGKPQLLAAAQSIVECSDPSCNKRMHSVTLASSCCRHALISTYEPIINALVMSCPSCGTPSLVIAVAEEPPHMEWEPHPAGHANAKNEIVVAAPKPLEPLKPAMVVRGPGSVN